MWSEGQITDLNSTFKYEYNLLIMISSRRGVSNNWTSRSTVYIKVESPRTHIQYPLFNEETLLKVPEGYTPVMRSP